MNATNQAGLTAKRKMQFFLFLPIFIIPLFTLLFWLLGGGQGDALAATPQHTVNGLNLQLPSARLKDESKLTKLDYYRRADQDSAKRLTLIKNDPYYRLARLSTLQPDTPQLAAQLKASPQAAGIRSHSYRSPIAVDSDRNEVKVYRKLATLSAALNSSAPSTSKPMPASRDSYSPDLAQVESSMQNLRRKDTAIDPELSELSKMVDKLVALQKGVPASGAEDRPAGSIPPTNVSVLRPRLDSTESGWNGAPDSSSRIDVAKPPVEARNNFYSVDPDPSSDATATAISATVAESQTVVSGGTLALRLSQPCTIAGIDLPAGQPIYGTVQLSGERMTVNIKTIRFENRIIPVSLAAFDLDGLAGVAIPDGIAREVAKQSADQSIESIGLTSVDQSFGAQAATAGLQAAKNLLSKKVRVVTVTIPAGYEILLQDNQASSH